MGADAFVAIDKGVVFHQAKSQPRGFLLKGWIGICSVEALEWCR